MIYLSLDQAMRTTGWAIFEDDELKKYGSFTIPSHHPIEQRLNEFMRELNNLYREYEFDELFFEDIQNQNNNETYKKLAYVQSTIIIWCYNNNIKFSVLSPSHWRSVLKERCGISFGRKREEQKQKAIEFVQQFFARMVSSDEADAICLGYAGICEQGRTESAF